MKTIAIINQKGGVGKTCSCTNLGAGLARLNKKILLIDLDPQAHLTHGLGVEAHELDQSIYELLKGEASAQEVLVERGELKIIPSTLDLSGAELELSGIPGREFLLREGLDGLRGFDYALIDCPPSLGLLTLNALTTAQEVYIPVQAEYLALQGMSKLLQAVEVVKKRLNKGLEITGVIGTRFDSRKKLNREVVDKIREHFDNKLFKTLIRDNVSLAEAPSFGQTIFEYKPDSYGAEDYTALSQEAIKRS